MTLSRDAVLTVIADAIQEVNEFRSENNKVTFGEDVVLFGPDSSIDSLDLVSLITDVEEALSDRFDLDVSLTDDRALAHVPSPFDTVKCLTDYIMTLADESAGSA